MTLGRNASGHWLRNFGATHQLNLAYRWFCGRGIEDSIPDPSAFLRADPVGSGFVRSLARPGGNITGFLNFRASLAIDDLLLAQRTVLTFTSNGDGSNADSNAHDSGTGSSGGDNNTLG